MQCTLLGDGEREGRRLSPMSGGCAFIEWSGISSSRKICFLLFLCILIIYLLSVCTHVDAFYTLGYNPILHFFLKMFQFGPVGAFMLAPVSHWHPSSFCFLENFTTLWHIRCSRFILYFPCPSPKISYISKHSERLYYISFNNCKRKMIEKQ